MSSGEEEASGRLAAWLRRRLCGMARHRRQREIEGSAAYFSRRCWCGSFWVEFGAPQRGNWREGFRFEAEDGQ